MFAALLLAVSSLVVQTPTPTPTPASEGDGRDAALVLVVPRGTGSPTVSPDGTRLVMSSGGVMWLWDVPARLPLAGLQGLDRGDIWKQRAFSGDGGRLVASALRGAWMAVDPRDGRRLAAGAPEDGSGRVDARFEARGEQVAQHDGDHIVVRRLADGSVVADVPARLGLSDTRAFSLSPDGSRLVFVDRELAHWLDLSGDIEQAREIEGCHGTWTSIVASDDGELVWLCGASGLRVVDGRGGELLASGGKDDMTTRFVGLLADGSLAIVHGEDGVLRGVAFDAASAALRIAWERPGLGALRLDPVAETLAVREGMTGLIVLDARDARELWRDDLPGRRLEVGQGPAGVMHLTEERVTRRVDARTGEPLGSLQDGRARTLAGGLRPGDGLWFVDDARTLALLDATSGAERLHVTLDAQPRAALCGPTSLVVLGEDDVLRVFDADTLVERVRVPSVGSVRASRDGERALCLGGGVPGVRVLRLRDGSVVATHGVGFGELRDVATDRDLRVFAVIDAERIPHMLVDGVDVALGRALGHVSSCVVDPDGRWVAWGGADAQLHVNATSDGALVAFPELEGWWPFGVDVRALEVTPDGSCLMATTGDLGSVQSFETSDWSRRWVLEFGGGNPGTLELVCEATGERVWSWGMDASTSRAIDVASGETQADLSRTGLTNFAPGSSGDRIVGLRDGSLVVLDRRGRLLLERVDLGEPGVVVSSAASGVRGDAQALARVFVDVDGRLVRADRWLAGDDLRR